MTQLNRRNALTAAATLPAIAVPEALAATNNPDQELIELGSQFDVLERQFHDTAEKVRSRNNAFYQMLKEDTEPRSYEHDDEIWHRLDQEFGPEPKPDCEDICEAIGPLELLIMELPAFTLTGLAVKARIAQFECSRFYDKADDDADLDHRSARELIDSVLEAAQRAPRRLITNN